MVHAIEQAAAELFAELGYARTTTNKIAQRAGVSIGSLYQYFPNKDSLLAALLDRHHADVHAIVHKALTRLKDPHTELEQGWRQFIAELIDVHTAHPALTKALSAEVVGESATVADKIKREDRQSGIATLLATRPDVRRGNYEAMAAVLTQTIGPLTRWLVHDAPTDIDREALFNEVIHLLVSYLRS